MNPVGSVQEWIGASLGIREQISWRTSPNANASLTGFQVRAARGILNCKSAPKVDPSRMRYQYFEK
jgi:hypothetical protein